MARPIKEIKCRFCQRIVGAIILKEYDKQSKSDPDEFLVLQKLLIKDHRISFWKSRHCDASNKKITILIGRNDLQARHH